MPSVRHAFPKGWAKQRVRVLERDGYVCMAPRHHPSCEGIANSVDHILPRARGGSHEDSNLRAAWGKCNSLMGGRISTRKRKGLPRARVSRWA